MNLVVIASVLVKKGASGGPHKRAFACFVRGTQYIDAHLQRPEGDLSAEGSDLLKLD
jgi:hypothetical protein